MVKPLEINLDYKEKDICSNELIFEDIIECYIRDQMIELKLAPGIRPRRYYPEKVGTKRTPVEVNEEEEIWDILDIIDEIYDDFGFEPSDDDYGMKCSDGNREYDLLSPPEYLVPQICYKVREASDLEKIDEEEKGYFYVRFEGTNFKIPITLRMNSRYHKEEIIFGKPRKLEKIVR